MIEPESAPVVKRRFTLRAALILGMLPILVLGAVGLYRVTKGPTLDELATELAIKLAPAVVAVYATPGDSAVVSQAVAIRRAWEASTGCKALGGAIVPGSTRAGITDSARRLIASARQGGQIPEGAGTGYAVIATNGAVPHVKYMAVVVVVSCVVPSTPTPGFGVGS